MPEASLFLKLYRLLLKLYPATFREEYAVPMERAFRDELAESHNIWALAALWLRLLSDLAKSIPLQLMREIRQDTRHTLRLWVKTPGNTAFAMLALAIGIGANTGVFSVVNALVLRSLPLPGSKPSGVPSYISNSSRQLPAISRLAPPKYLSCRCRAV
jgi:hypothetical protein